MNTEREEEDIAAEIQEGTARALKEFLIWITGDMEGTQERAGKRAFVALWVIDPRFSHLTQAGLARKLGHKDKQSIGRIVEEFQERYGKFTPRHKSRGSRTTASVELVPLEDENEEEQE